MKAILLFAVIIGVVYANFQFDCHQGFMNGDICSCYAGWTGIDCSECVAGNMINTQQCQAGTGSFELGYQTRICETLPNHPVPPNYETTLIADLLPSWGVVELNFYFNGSIEVANCTFVDCSYTGSSISCSNSTCMCSSECSSLEEKVFSQISGPSSIECTGSSCTLMHESSVILGLQCASNSTFIAPAVVSTYLNYYYYDNPTCSGLPQYYISTLPNITTNNCFYWPWNQTYYRYLGRTTLNPSFYYLQMYANSCGDHTPISLITYPFSCEQNYDPFNTPQGGFVQFDFTPSVLPSKRGYAALVTYSTNPNPGTCSGPIFSVSYTMTNSCLSGFADEKVVYSCDNGVTSVTQYSDSACSFNSSTLYYSGDTSVTCAVSDVKYTCPTSSGNGQLYGLYSLSKDPNCENYFEYAILPTAVCNQQTCHQGFHVDCRFSEPMFPNTQGKALFSVEIQGVNVKVAVDLNELETFVQSQVVVIQCVDSQTALVQNCVTATQCAAGVATLTPQGFEKVPVGWNLPYPNMTLIGCNKN